MSTFISMLRGINVSGQKKLRMVELKKMYETLDLVNVETYVQSGNVLFDSAEQDTIQLAHLIEAQIEQTFGYQVTVFIRNAHDFQRIIEGNPFGRTGEADPSKLHVTFLSGPPAKSMVSQLAVPTGDPGQFLVGEQEIFLFCPAGYGTSKLSNTFFEKKLKMTATTRNWNTVKALYQLATLRHR